GFLSISRRLNRVSCQKSRTHEAIRPPRQRRHTCHYNGSVRATSASSQSCLFIPGATRTKKRADRRTETFHLYCTKDKFSQSIAWLQERFSTGRNLYPYTRYPCPPPRS